MNHDQLVLSLSDKVTALEVALAKALTEALTEAEPTPPPPASDPKQDQLDLLWGRLQSLEDQIHRLRYAKKYGTCELRKGDLVRVKKCCTCETCSKFLGRIAMVRETEHEDQWLCGGLLRLSLFDAITHCCFKSSQVELVVRNANK